MWSIALISRRLQTHLLYSEGYVLQEHREPDRSGFHMVLVDLDSQLRRVVSYRWSNPSFSVVSDTNWQAYSRTTRRTNIPFPSAEFLAKLSDSGIGLTHRTKGPILLDSIWVY